MTIGLLDDTLIDALPEGYTARPARMDDLELMTEMCNAYSLAVHGVAQHRARDIRREWELETWDLQKYSRIVHAPDGSVAGWVETWNLNPPHVRPALWARVHPDQRGRGIGAAMVRWGEALMRSEIDKAEPGAKVELVNGVEALDPAAQSLMLSLGFEETRRFWRMEIDLDTLPPEPVWPEGITVRAMQTRDDEREAYKVVRASFKDHWGYVETPFDEGWQHWSHFTFNDEYDPSCRYLAMDGDRIVAVSMNRNRISDNPDIAWIGTLGVLREYRGKGIAKALLLHSFREFHGRGKMAVGLGVDASSLTGATRLYTSVGMHVERESVHYSKTLREGVDLSTQSV